MNRKIGKLRQWTGEKLGSQAKTNTTEEFKEMEHEMDLRKKGLDDLHEAMTSYLHVLTKKYSYSGGAKTTPLDHLGTIMMQHGEEYGSESPFGDCLIKLGIGHQKVASFQDEYVAKLQEGYMESLDKALSSMKEYQTQRKKLESRRLAYDAALSKLQKAKKENPQFEEELREAKAKYEDTAESVQNRMNSFRDAEPTHMNELTTFLEISIAFHERSRDALLAVKNTWVDEKNMQEVKSPKLSRAHTFQPSRKSTAESISNGDSIKSSSDARKLRKRTSAISMHQSAKRSGNTTSKSKKVKIEFNFEAENDTELDLTIGDIVTVLEEIDENWWKGQVKRSDGSIQTGIFPTNYTVPYEEVNDYDDEEVEEIDIPPPMPQRPTSRAMPPPSQPIPSQKAQEMKKSLSFVRTVKAEFDYDAEAEKEISLRIGDIIRVTNDEDDGWWIGELDRDGVIKRGWFPANYTIPLDEDENDQEELSTPPPMPTRPVNGRPVSQPYSNSRDMSDEEINHSKPPPMPTRRFPTTSPPRTIAPPRIALSTLTTSRRIAPMSKPSQTSTTNLTKKSSPPPPPIPQSRRATITNNSIRPSSTISTHSSIDVSPPITPLLGASPGPPIPSRASKPSPSTSRSSSAISLPHSSTLERVKARAPSSSGYISREFFEANQNQVEEVVASCSTCGCDEFQPNVFKKNSCNNCFHIH